MPVVRRIRRSIAALLLVLFLPSCYHYVTPKEMTPQEYIATKAPKQVRVTLIDSTRVVLRDPFITPDSIGGHTQIRQDAPASRWAVALSRVERFEGHEYDNWAVAGIVAGAMVVVGGLCFVGAIIALSHQ